MHFDSFRVTGGFGFAHVPPGNFKNADLSGAHLIGIYRRVDFEGANLDGALLHGNFQNAKNLDKARNIAKAVLKGYCPDHTTQDNCYPDHLQHRDLHEVLCERGIDAWWWMIENCDLEDLDSLDIDWNTRLVILNPYMIYKVVDGVCQSEDSSQEMSKLKERLKCEGEAWKDIIVGRFCRNNYGFDRWLREEWNCDEWGLIAESRA